MDVLAILRVLTVAVRVALAVALVYLVLGPGRRLQEGRRAAWGALAAFSAILAFDNALLEVLLRLARSLPADAPLERIRMLVYHATYLLHAGLSAALPLALMVALGRGPAMRRMTLAAVALIGTWSLVGAATGALTGWARLLEVTRVLSFVGIPAYLGFWGLLLLGRLREVDVYFAGFVAVRTFFILLLPIQEAVFELVGRDAVRQVWHVHQFLQFGASLVQLLLVVALARALVACGQPRRVGAPVPG